MKKTTVNLIFFTLIVYINTFAQNSTGVLKYNQIMAIGNVVQSTSVLLELRFNQTESSVVTVGNTKLIYMKTDSTKMFDFVKKGASRIYKNRLTKRIKSQELAFNQRVVVDDTLSKIRWKITRKTKQIGQFLCREAEADIWGRHYIAWFTPEIPISDGPWKLYGLPGLILEAKEETGKLQFLYEGLMFPTEAIIEEIVPTTKQKVMNTVDYVKQFNKNMQDFTNMMSTDPKYPGASVRVDSKTIEIIKE